MQKRLYTAASLTCLGVICLSVLSYFCAKFVMDDALMFVRYANNWASTGSISWNVGDGPAYGVTSLAYLGVVTVATGVLPWSPYAICQTASCSVGVLFLVSTVLTVALETTKCSRAFVLLLVMAGLAGGATFLAAQFTTGMDTTLAMLSVSALVMVWRRAETVDSRAAGVLGGLALLVRPDLLLFTIGVPAIVWTSGKPTDRLYWRSVTLWSSAVATILFGTLFTVFGTPVPLPTFAKIFAPYGAYFQSGFRFTPIKQSVALAGAYWMLFSVTLCLLCLNRRTLVKREHRLVLAILLMAGAWLVYLSGVTQIMAYRGRFYHPMLPAVLFLMIWGSQQSLSAWRNWLDQAPGTIGAAAACVVLASVMPEALSVAGELRTHLREGHVGRYDVVTSYNHYWSDIWYRLPEMTSVSPDLSIATTEVGLPGILLPKGSVIDLAGLNDTQIALHGFSAAGIVRDRKPDVIYLPHPNYVGMNQAFQSDQDFAILYDYYPGDRLGVLMGVAIRRDGAHFNSLKALMPEIVR